MRIAKSSFVFFFLLNMGLLFPIFAQTPYTGVAVFGDSYSDLGNMPESVLVRPDTETPAHSLHIAVNLYLPVSNPTTAFTTSLNNIQKNLFLPEQSAMLCSAAYSPVKCYPRQFHSSGWVEYFSSAMVKSGLIKSSFEVLPSLVVEGIIPPARKMPVTQSALFIDYAMYSALAGHLQSDNKTTCYNENRKPITPTVNDNCDNAVNLRHDDPKKE